MKSRKILSLVLALVLLLAFAVPMTALAADITIDNNHPNVSINGKTYTAYKLLDVEKTPGSTDTYVYTIPAEYTDAALKALLQQIIDQQAFASNLGAVKALAIQILGTYESTLIKEDVEVTGQTGVIEDLDPGYYIVTGHATAPTAQEIVAAITLTTITQNAIIHPKADAPKLGGDGTEADQGKLVSNDNGANWALNVDAEIGDTVKYKIQSHVPDMNGYSSYIFRFEDVIDLGLTYTGNLTVTVGTTPVTASCLVTAPTAGTPGGNLIVDLSDIIKNQTVGALIVVEYTARLNENALIDTANDNTVKLKYSNNPHWNDPNHPDVDPDFKPGEPNQIEPEGETPPAVAKVYTTDINIYKTNNNGGTSVALAGAGFTLTRNGTVVDFVLDKAAGDETEPNVYRVAESTETPVGIVSPESGLIQLKGLDRGTYVLEETTVPTGFNKAADQTITIGYANCAFTKTPDLTTINVQNKSGLELPETGGMGEMLFIIAGLVVVAIFGVGYMVYRKRSTLSALNGK